MTQIFVSHTKDDTDCAEHIRQDLEARGYTTWREPETLTMESILYPRTIEIVILGSAAVVLVWSKSAAQSEWVDRHILFAQQLKKSIVPVVIDGTGLPTTLIVDTIIKSPLPCMNAVTQLPPDFPQPGTTDSLVRISEQAAHEFIPERKAAIDQAAEMLKRGEQREAVLAILEYLAQNDLMTGVRDKAQEVLDANTKKGVAPAFRPDESRHIISVRCQRCGYINHFDKRHICSEQSQVARRREELAGKQLDKMSLPCANCDHKMKKLVDCSEYPRRDTHE